MSFRREPTTSTSEEKDSGKKPKSASSALSALSVSSSESGEQKETTESWEVIDKGKHPSSDVKESGNDNKNKPKPGKSSPFYP